MPFISSPYMTASPFSEISHDNIPASLRDVHRTHICGGFFVWYAQIYWWWLLCDVHRTISDGLYGMHADVSDSLCVMCTELSEMVYVWCAQSCQWWCVCESHRSISDGFCVICTDLSVMVCVWITQIYQWWFLCDMHRSISDSFCVICTDLSVMVFVWCAQIYQRWFMCDVHRTISDGFCVMRTDLSLYQWWFLCDVRRNISDGLHGMHTDLSVMVCMWCAQIYQLGWQPTFHQLSLPTLPPHPLPPTSSYCLSLLSPWFYIMTYLMVCAWCAQHYQLCSHAVPQPLLPEMCQSQGPWGSRWCLSAKQFAAFLFLISLFLAHLQSTLHKTTLLIHCRN